jgi:hypothetical protein
MINDVPVFNFCDNIITISGRAIPEHAAVAWFDFLDKLKVYVKSTYHLTIDFKLEYYNSSSSMYITDMFHILSNCRACKAVVNWYYYPADETSMENGEIYKESNSKVTVNLIERDKK